jgi:endonuclease YncB( thermonuclease family)
LVRYASCAGWGLCTFDLAEPDPLLGQIVRVRLRGIGDPALVGTCDPEQEAARSVREFIQGVLTRATRIELAKVEPRAGGTVLATVLADGTDVTDIVVHIGFGRGLAMGPDTKWCD